MVSPTLLKIIDEIFVNAQDNVGHGTTLIKIKLDKVHIEVYNNGDTIPVEATERGMMVPELAFGHLRSGSNYDDDNQARTTGGRNGLGAKLTNIFSTKFEVVCKDQINHKQFKQTWTNNMKIAQKPSVTAFSGKSGSTQVSFWPDFARMRLEGFDATHTAWIYRRVIDLAATTPRVTVKLNGKKVFVSNFRAYPGMFLLEKDADEAKTSASDDTVLEVCRARMYG